MVCSGASRFMPPRCRSTRCTTARVFIADTGGYVYCFDAASGTLVWETKVGGICDISSPTLSGGLLFIGTRDETDGALLALSEMTGKILWRYDVGCSITAPPSVAGGMMFCGSDGWNAYAFDIGDGLGDWSLHRYDSWNTAYSPTGLSDLAICVRRLQRA